MIAKTETAMKRKAESPKPTPDELRAHADKLNTQRRNPLDFVYFASFSDEAAEGEMTIGKSALVDHVQRAIEHLQEKDDPYTRRVLALRPVHTTGPLDLAFETPARCWLFPLPASVDALKPNTMLNDLCMVTASLNMIYDNDPCSRRARPQVLPNPQLLSALNFATDDAMSAKTETLLMNIMALLRAFAQSTPKQNFTLPSCSDGWFVAPGGEKLVYVLMAHMFSDDPNWRPVVIKGWTSLIRRCVEVDPLFIHDMIETSYGSLTPRQFRSSVANGVESMLRTSSDMRVGSDMMLSQDTSDIREIVKEMVSGEKGLGSKLACFLGN